jgi:hypothetical protein
MNVLAKSVLVALVVAACAAGVPASSTAASFTCAGAAMCDFTATGRGFAFAVGTNIVRCDALFTADVRDGDRTITANNVTFAQCVGPFGCAAPVVVAKNINRWTLTPDASTPDAPNSWALNVMLGGMTVTCGGATGNISLAPQNLRRRRILYTVAAPQRIEMDADATYTATGLIALVIGSSGTGRITAAGVSDGGQPLTVVTAPAGGLTIS